MAADYGRRYRLSHFNLTPEDYDALLKAQLGGCWACHRPPTGSASLAVDHDHKTGQVRGLLCMRCNRLLGAMERHPPQVVARLVVYRECPPAEDVIGIRIGNTGRSGTKAWRAQTKRRLKRGKADG